MYILYPKISITYQEGPTHTLLLQVRIIHLTRYKNDCVTRVRHLLTLQK